MRRRWAGFVRLHITGMGLSYILLLTAFYVDNGMNLPVWKDLPPIAYWTVPAMIGAPIMIWALLYHDPAVARRQPYHAESLKQRMHRPSARYAGVDLMKLGNDEDAGDF